MMPLDTSLTSGPTSASNTTAPTNNIANTTAATGGGATSARVVTTSGGVGLTDRLYRIRSNTDSDLHSGGGIAATAVDRSFVDSPAELNATASAMPRHSRERLYRLFGLIEKEFETLFAENLALHAKVEALTERLTEGGALPPEGAAEILGITAADVVAGKQKKTTQMGQKIRTALKVGAPVGGRLVSSFKVVGVGGGDASRRARFVRQYDGHRDGVWHVATAPGGRTPNLFGTASADQTARIWCMETGRCLATYAGHSGSVNSIEFNPGPADDVGLTAVTASGDQSAHIWKVPASLLQLIDTAATSARAQHQSSEDELEAPLSEREETTAMTADDGDVGASNTVLRQPLRQLTGHNGVVIAADWLNGGDQVITASWDRNAHIYDAEKGGIVSILSGHDQELTHCKAHNSQSLVVTASKDTTFRLWDFRVPIHSVAVFQGHTESVTSAMFSSTDKVISGSDDRTVKVWDLKNMRSALATIRLDSPANRLSVSSTYNIIAIPHDNRHVRLYDLQGIRLARLPRSNRRCHRRMVCCTAWADDHPTTNLFTCGFDKITIGWKVLTS